MRRLFWMIVGGVLVALLISKGREIANRLTPAGIAQQVEERGQRAAANAGDIFATFRTAMAQREAELRDELGMPAADAR